jgi:hypothetical protein
MGEMKIWKSMHGFGGFLTAMALAPAAFAGCIGMTTTATTSDAHLIWTSSAVRACTLVLAGDADMDEWWQCVETVGDQQPANSVLLDCAAAITWHSQTDGRVAGLKIDECFRKRPVKAAQGTSPGGAAPAPVFPVPQ